MLYVPFVLRSLLFVGREGLEDFKSQRFEGQRRGVYMSFGVGSLVKVVLYYVVLKSLTCTVRKHNNEITM